jgi:hypothetical protein
VPIVGLLVALIPIFNGLFFGSALSVVLAGLTIEQWAVIAVSIAGLIVKEPQVEAELRKIHTSVDKLIDDIKTHGHVVAAKNAHALYSAPPLPSLTWWV